VGRFEEMAGLGVPEDDGVGLVEVHSYGMKVAEVDGDFVIKRGSSFLAIRKLAKKDWTKKQMHAKTFSSDHDAKYALKRIAELGHLGFMGLGGPAESESRFDQMAGLTEGVEQAKRVKARMDTINGKPGVALTLNSKTYGLNVKTADALAHQIKQAAKTAHNAATFAALEGEDADEAGLSESHSPKAKKLIRSAVLSIEASLDIAMQDVKAAKTTKSKRDDKLDAAMKRLSKARNAEVDKLVGLINKHL
jgi:hypothetical protein